VFVIDATGVVIAANSSAREFVGFTRKSPASLSFAGLFASGPFAANQPGADDWKTFVAATLDRWTSFCVRMPEGEREVRVRLERSAGGAGSYIATMCGV
jgi:hypothetical protein